MAFQPNRLSFADGVAMLRDAAERSGLRTDSIITSKDSAAKNAMRLLEVNNVPDGFTKWMLPVYMSGPSQQYFSYAAPNTKVPRHSHNEGDGLRIILHGSMIYRGIELVAGDWMFIPKGIQYEFEVGPMGIGMFYCYECCCA